MAQPVEQEEAKDILSTQLETSLTLKDKQADSGEDIPPTTKTSDSQNKNSNSNSNSEERENSSSNHSNNNIQPKGKESTGGEGREEDTLRIQAEEEWATVEKLQGTTYTTSISSISII